MRRMTLVTSGLLLLVMSSSAAAFGVRLDDCGALPADLRLFEMHPELASACDSIVEARGERYLRMNAELRQIRDDLLVLRFKGTTRDMALSPGAVDPPGAAGGNGSLSQDLPVGSPLHVYIPQDGALDAFAAPAGGDAALVPVGVELEQPLEQRIATYTCCKRRRPWYPIPEFLPVTASPLPLFGLLGMSMLGAAALLRHRRLRRH